MMRIASSRFFLLGFFFLKCKAIDDADFKVDNWKFHFIPGTGMGLFMALALPLGGPYKNAYLAYNFEANYLVPGNETSFEYPPLLGRNIDRTLIYKALETKLRSIGYMGKPCLLRIICELASSHTILHANGILGDILHVVFTPSSSKNPDLEEDYEKAEEVGRQVGNCSKFSKKCRTSFLDIVTWLGNSIQKDGNEQ
ncbi:uncharacterized protein LOC123316777 [Coccinella septempunctata]|uniref:uncharacterized protein LOC123316777 n=1 Tax=Coccinella septempunctata TaxID=41139 RepID=UPI001D08F5DC|nr:uncharacterized protein LOC123316777 [Coccinella septempunctata]